MKCRRAFETDLLAVLRGEGGDVEFLAHYPTCADCAAELRVWGELDAMLQAGAPAPAAHPSEETLLAFADAPATLATDARAEVERHLATCRTCADEVGSLRRFDPANVGETAPLAARAATPAPARPAVTWRASGESGTAGSGWFGRLVWHPAFAYALVAALLLPLVRSQLERLSVPARFSEAEPTSGARPRVVPGGGADQPAAPAAPAPAVQAPSDEARPRQMPAPDPRREYDRQRADLARRKQASPDAELATAEVAEKKAEAVNENLPAGTVLADRLTQPRFEAGAPDRGALAGRAAAAPAPAGGMAPQEAAQVATAPRAAANSALTPLVELRANAPTTIPFAVAARGPMLHIATPATLGERPIDVSVRARAGARELTQRITSRANAIALQIPPEWLAAGDYAVTLTPVAPPHAADADGNFVAVAPITFGFTVQASAGASGAR